MFHPVSHRQHTIERNCGGHTGTHNSYCSPSTRYRVKVTVSMQAVLLRQTV